MHRSVLLVCAITVGLVLGGMWLQRRIGDSGSSVQPASIDAGPVDARARDASTGTRDGAPTPDRVEVTSASGSAERYTSGGWTTLRPGDVLLPSDEIRTGSDGGVALTLGDAEVRLDPSTRLTVSEMNAAVARVLLSQGRVEAIAPGTGATRVGVAVADSDTVAQSIDGDFAVLSPGNGDATISATRGVVSVRSGGESITMTPGQQTLVRRHQAPLSPQDIPSSLFLKFERDTLVAAKKRHTIRGTVAPGAMVTVQGKSVLADQDGEFVSVITLREGDNRVRIRTVDARGQRAQKVETVQLDMTGPDVSGQVDWGTSP